MIPQGTFADRSLYLFYLTILIFLLHILGCNARGIIRGVLHLIPLQKVHQPFNMLGNLFHISMLAAT